MAFHRNCNRTARKFFEDFDMLPWHIKQMLCDGPHMPDFDDLRAAWELAAEGQDLASLIDRVRCLAPTPEEKRARAEAEKKRAEQAERDRRARERMKGYTVPIYGPPRLKDDPKHGRLVTLVSEEQAMKLLAARKENKDVTNAYERPIIGWKTVIEKPAIDPNTLPPEKPAAPVALTKAMHNAGGKK